MSRDASTSCRARKRMPRLHVCLSPKRVAQIEELCEREELTRSEYFSRLHDHARHIVFSGPPAARRQ